MDEKGVENRGRAGVSAHFKHILSNFIFMSKWIKAAILYSIDLDFYQKCVGFSLVIGQCRKLSMIILTNEMTVCHMYLITEVRFFDNNILSRHFF